MGTRGAWGQRNPFFPRKSSPPACTPQPFGSFPGTRRAASHPHPPASASLAPSAWKRVPCSPIRRSALFTDVIPGYHMARGPRCTLSAHLFSEVHECGTLIPAGSPGFPGWLNGTSPPGGVPSTQPSPSGRSSLPAEVFLNQNCQARAGGGPGVPIPRVRRWRRLVQSMLEMP